MSDASATKVLVMAGGTGGHVFPALAVANVLRDQGVEIQWLGTAKRIEAKLVPEAGIKLNCIEVEGVRGKGKLSLVLAPFKLLTALWQAAKVLRQVRPDVVIGFGGFASGPGGFMAKLMGIPLVIHEQNAIAGTTNKLLRPLANTVMQAFPGALASAAVVGNPVRADIVELPAPAERMQGRSSNTGTRNLLVVGGSLGAKAINEIMPTALKLMAADIRPAVWHQAGRDHEESTQELYQQCGINDAKVEAFVDDMAAAYRWADIIVCRAGALTVSELTAAGLAAVLIPYPWAIDDHQAKNAQVLVSANAGRMHRQDSLNAAALAAELTGLLSDSAQLIKMAESARALALPNAAEDVAQACLELCNA